MIDERNIKNKISEITNAEEKNQGEIDRFLEFSLGDENYAIPLLQVREVIAVPATTPVPYAPEHFIGIMNLRGQVISVMDLRKKMKIKTHEENEQEAVIVVDLDPIFLGVKVDSVNSVLPVPRSKISEAPEMDSKMKTDYILGIFRDKDRMTILMDIGRVLDVTDAKVLKGKAA